MDEWKTIKPKAPRIGPKAPVPSATPPVLRPKEKEKHSSAQHRRDLEFVQVQKKRDEGEYLSEGAAREWSTVVDISIKPPSFKLVSLSSPRSPPFKTLKQVFFNPIHILTLLPHFSLIIIINLLFSF